MSIMEFHTSKTLEKLNAMTGMGEIKQAINEIVSFVTIAQRRKDMGLKADAHNIHMVFKGSPGTGKTTVARMVANIFSELGVLEKPDYITNSWGEQYTDPITKGRKLKSDWEPPFIELDNSHIAHPHVGVGERIMRDKITEAQGGVLFIDEAYSMIGHSHHNSDNKIMAVLVKGMEDYAGKFICIFAGYEDEMQEFMDFNTGLRSRVPFQVNFPDYGIDELISIAEGMCKTHDYQMDNTFVDAMKMILRIEKQADHFGNGRTVRNIMEKAIRNQSIRLYQENQSLSRDKLMTLTAADLAEQIKESKQRISDQKKSKNSQRRDFTESLKKKMMEDGEALEVGA